MYLHTLILLAKPDDGIRPSSIKEFKENMGKIKCFQPNHKTPINTPITTHGDMKKELSCQLEDP
jgi:hypothetical protein